MEFECDGMLYDTFEEIPDDHEYDSKAEAMLNETCENTLEVPSKTGMAHVGVPASDFWCDECGKHYTASEAKAKARNQAEEGV